MSSLWCFVCSSAAATLPLHSVAPVLVHARHMLSRLSASVAVHTPRCFYMEPNEDKEVVFLKKRTGFVR